MLFATGLTFGQKQHEYRPLPIYRYVNLQVDKQDVMDSQQPFLQAIQSVCLILIALVWFGEAGIQLISQVLITSYCLIIQPVDFMNLKLVVINSEPVIYSLTSGIFHRISVLRNSITVTLNFVSKVSKYLGPAMTAMVTTKFRSEIINPTQWDTLMSANIPVPNNTSTSAWTESGAVNIDGNKYNSDSVCIAFRYTSTTGGAANYYLDSIKITGTPVGIKEINAAVNLLHIYPNPVTSMVTISNSEMMNKIEIYNMVGELVSAYENVDNTKCAINVASLQQGLYFTKVTLKNGTVVSKKMVKE